MEKNKKHALPLVTIGMPTFNRADRYLKDALRSAVSQTYSNIEIVISDNASTDSTEALVKSFDDPRVRYFRQSRNIGMLNNENFCVEKAGGDYFLLLHDDDLIDNDFIEVCMDAVNGNTDVGIILTGVRKIDGEGRTTREAANNAEGLSTTDFFLGWFDNKLPLYLCSTLYNTRRLKEIGCFRSRHNLYEDNIALFHLAARFGRKDIHDIKASFRRHDSNMGDDARLYEWCEESLYLLNIMCSLAPEHSTLIKDRGMSYFCRNNYRRAAKTRSPVKRFLAYLTVYRTFNFSYSPLRFIYSGEIRSVRNFLKRNVPGKLKNECRVSR